MGRPYSVQFNNVSVSAVQDLIGLYCGASMACKLSGVVVGQITNATAALLRVSINRLPATVTSGSVGTSATPQKINRGDASATATARVNDTTQATTSGTKAVLHSDVFNTVNGYQFFWPAGSTDLRPVIGLSEAVVFSLDTAPGAAMTMSGTLYFEELF
jgi:hypothetical protein